MSTLPDNLLDGWTFVIAEDEPDSFTVASFILEFFGAKVHGASDGKQALETIRSMKPDVVISDLSMPVMDGWELIHRLRMDAATRELPVIALTAHAMKGDRERAMAVGFTNYLTKPLTADTFIGQLVNLLLDIPLLNERLHF